MVAKAGSTQLMKLNSLYANKYRHSVKCIYFQQLNLEYMIIVIL